MNGRQKPMRDENGEWRRLQNAELHSLYRSPNIVRVIKYRSLRRAGYVDRSNLIHLVYLMLTSLIRSLLLNQVATHCPQ